MADYLLHIGASVSCPHQGQVSIISSNMNVKVSGKAVATSNDTFTVAGCPFTITTPAPKSQPCVKVQWIVPAKHVRVNRQPVLLAESKGICQSIEQIPQGPPGIKQTQRRVKGT
jgi:hypothetical protein